MDSRELLAEVPLAQWDEEEEDENPRKGSGTPSSSEAILSGSLEDLVHSFDEKLTVVFENGLSVDDLAPVQVRSQEEIMEDCQVWWTITGNFGSMMPIDWAKSSARSKQFPALNLCGPEGSTSSNPSADSSRINPDPEEEDLIAADLDMHTLILSSRAHLEDETPLKSAEEIIKEIDEIIVQEESEESAAEASLPPSESPGLLDSLLQGRPLKSLSLNELIHLNGELEVLVRELSEELVSDLGVRDELEMEKEIKNSFISLLLNIQSKLRGSKRNANGRSASKYLTTVIPYARNNEPPGCPGVPVLVVLVKVLKAINEDSPAVPALLTDYILKILCPSK